jgi:hypothetical protein
MAQPAVRQPQDVRPKLTPKTLEEFMAQVRSDPKFKARAIASVKAGGLAGVAEDFFDLNDKQRDNLAAHKDSGKDAQDTIANGVASAFQTNGSVSLQEPVSPLARGISVGVHVGADGSVDVSISCAL